MIELGILKNDKFQKNGIKIVVLVIAFIIVAVMVFAGPSIFYKMKIREFKTRHPEKYAFFPDSFPKGSTDRRYFYLPNLMQGQGYLMISFTVKDQKYINDLYDRYTDNICIYTYDKVNGSKYEWKNEDNLYRYYTFEEPYISTSGYELYEWVNNEEDYFMFSSIDHYIEDKEKVEMIMTYEYPSGDPDVNEYGGIVIDDTDCKVYFWVDN